MTSSKTSARRNVLVTGAGGFIGQACVPLWRQHHDVETVSVRQALPDETVLADIDTIIHLAGIIPNKDKPDDTVFDQVNRDLTIELARRAKSSGVRHFIFMSTAAVHGNPVKGFDKRLNETTAHNPDAAYGRSKSQAEQALTDLQSGEFSVSIVRAPIVYGPGMDSKLNQLAALVRKLPVLPFGKIDNERSFVFTENLAALIERLIATGQSGAFIATDSEPVSTTEVIRILANCFGLSRRIVSMPKPLRHVLRSAKPDLYATLFGSFAFDASKTNERLDFTPSYDFEAAIQKTFGAN